MNVNQINKRLDEIREEIALKLVKKWEMEKLIEELKDEFDNLKEELDKKTKKAKK